MQQLVHRIHSSAEKKAALIKNAIYNLPEKYRKVLILREIDNMQYQDISDTLNINLSTIKSQIAKGRKIISKKVEKEFKKLDKLIEIL
jgi:RNA polymerase sigma-70 factor (ECF subfamily)